MKIAIIGTRGIPNYYGGFEQFAEYLSQGLQQKGHEVTVYNSHKHPYQELEWKGITINHQFDPEYRIGTAGQFIYDLNCILDSRKNNFDIVLQLGYTSSSVWGRLLPNDSLVITNMDGLEWKRSKYGKSTQQFLKKAEKWAVNTSDYLVADSLGIRDYLIKKFKADPTYIPYGAHVFKNPCEHVLKEFQLEKYKYNMLVARLEPENSIEIILDGVVQSESQMPFLVIGNHHTAYGEYLKGKYGSDNRIQFLGGIYDIKKLDNLRYYSNLYFHGHTVGGTNPSLLEAMASSAFICANDNPFNKYILEDDAVYFNNSFDVQKVLDLKKKIDHKEIIKNNITKIIEKYSWETIIDQYENLFLKAFNKKQKEELATRTPSYK